MPAVMASTAISQLSPSSSKASVMLGGNRAPRWAFRSPKSQEHIRQNFNRFCIMQARFCHLTPVLNLGNELLFLSQVENQAFSHIYTNSLKKV